MSQEAQRLRGKGRTIQVTDIANPKSIMIVVDLRGERFKDMDGGEYAARVAGVQSILSQDLVLLASADTKSGTIVRGPEGLGGAIYTMEIVEAEGHDESEGDDEGDAFINVNELVTALVAADSDPSEQPGDYAQIARWIAERYDVEIPEV